MSTATVNGNQKETAALIRVDPRMLSSAERLDAMSKSLESQMARASGQFQRAMILGSGLIQFREAITEEVVRQIVPLMGVATGFGTDKRPGDAPYDIGTVKEAFINSLLHGLYPVGMEWMIYRGNMLILKNGWDRKFRELAGVTDVEVVPGAAQKSGAGLWLVRVLVRWKKDGQKDELRDHEGKPGRQFAIPSSHDREKGDTIAGKAVAKAIRAAYQQASGVRLPDDDDETPAPKAKGTVAELLTVLPAGKAEEPDDALGEIELLKSELNFSPVEWVNFCKHAGVAPAGPWDERAAGKLLDALRETADARSGDSE